VDFTIEVQILDGQGMILLFINLVHYLIIWAYPEITVQKKAK
jgi:hypothetical protein